MYRKQNTTQEAFSIESTLRLLTSPASGSWTTMGWLCPVGAGTLITPPFQVNVLISMIRYDPQEEVKSLEPCIHKSLL